MKKQTYKIYFDKGNQAIFECGSFWLLMRYLETRKDYFKDITKIELI